MRDNRSVLTGTAGNGDAPTGHDRLAAIRARMPSPSELGPGRTPWDGLSREELVFLLASHHAALRAVEPVLDRAGPFLGRAERDAIASCRAAVGHVFPDYLGAPHDEKVGYGLYLEDGEEGPTQSERLDERLGSFRDLLAFDVPHFVWWACPTCGLRQGRAPGVEPAPLGTVSCEDGAACSFVRASWDGSRAACGAALPD